MISRSVYISFAVVLLAVSALANPAPVRNEKPEEYLQVSLLYFVKILFNLNQQNSCFLQSIQVLNDIEFKNNGNENTARSQFDILDNLSDFIRRNDVSLNLPVANTKVTISSRNLHNDEIDFKVKFSDGSAPTESRKSKLKKIAVPILTFVLLKAITLVPLLLGVLGIKAFNALQLSFFSFIISVALAVFQLCRKVCN